MVTVYDNKYSELVATALDEMRSTTDLTQLTPGGKTRALLEIVMRELGTMYSTFSMDLLQAFVKNAKGDNLDLIAEIMGLTRERENRNEVSDAVQVQKFYVESGTLGDINDNLQGSPQSFIIPAGTEVSTTEEGGVSIVYQLTEDCNCGAAQTEAYASIRAVEFGPASNIGAGALVNHNFDNYSDYLNESLKTQNMESIAYAVSSETNEELRYRIVNETTSSEAANYIAVRMAALSVPGVADVLLDEFSRGIGTGAVYIKAITPTVSEALALTVQDALHRARAFGNFVEAKAPKTIGVEMEVVLNLYKVIPSDEETALKKQVRDHITLYINGLDINESLEVDLLVRKILSVDANIRSTGTPIRPINRLYMWKYSASEDNRIRKEVPPGRNIEATMFERIVVEPTAPATGERITVRVA